jgi:hypothetical protein
MSTQSQREMELEDRIRELEDKLEQLEAHNLASPYDNEKEWQHYIHNNVLEDVREEKVLCSECGKVIHCQHIVVFKNHEPGTLIPDDDSPIDYFCNRTCLGQFGRNPYYE